MCSLVYVLKRPNPLNVYGSGPPGISIGNRSGFIQNGQFLNRDSFGRKVRGYWFKDF
jgi:hypothetical protein